jgi:hypothetical protein
MPTLDPYPLVATTFLEAVNIILAQIGVSARQSLDTETMNPETGEAVRTLHNWLISIQQAGWEWNREIGLELSPSPQPAGEITLPSNTLKVDTIYPSYNMQLVQRGLKLYNPLKQTYNIGQDADSVTVDLVVALEFEQLPQAVRDYVTIKAARGFAQNKLRDSLTNAFTSEQEMMALAKITEAEDESDDLTLFEKNPHLARRHSTRRY